MKFFETYRVMRERFLAGPDWVKIPDIEVMPGVRSRTVVVVSWLYGIYVRTLTTPGRVLVITAAFVIPFSTFTFDSPVRFMALGFIAAFSLDYLAGWFFKPKFILERRLPGRVRAGSVITIQYTAVNKRKFLPAWEIFFDPFNFDSSLVWLERPVVGCVQPGESVSVKAQIRTLRRGAYNLYSPIASSPFPLALTMNDYRRADAPDKLLVYPDFTPLTDLQLPPGARYQREGLAKISRIGESTDFLSCRQFRTGDDPRHIHWSGSARTGELVVKEFQEQFISRVALIVDTYIPRRQSFTLDFSVPERREKLEAMLCLAASVSDFLTREEHVVDLFAAGPDVFHFQAGRGFACMDNLLDVLAAIDFNRDAGIDSIEAEVMHEIAGIGCCVLLLPAWDDTHQNFVRELREAGVSVKPIIITGKDPIEPPPGGLVLSADDVFNGRVRVL
jgi:uncharacterized protein (DUF58 family)